MNYIFTLLKTRRRNSVKGFVKTNLRDSWIDTETGKANTQVSIYLLGNKIKLHIYGPYNLYRW